MTACRSTYRQLQDFVEHHVWRDVEVKHEVLGGRKKEKYLLTVFIFISTAYTFSFLQKHILVLVCKNEGNKAHSDSDSDSDLCFILCISNILFDAKFLLLLVLLLLMLLLLLLLSRVTSL